MLVSQRAQFLPSQRHAGKAAPESGHQSGMAHHPPLRLRHCLGEHAPADITTWRRCRLLEAGFEPELAERLAATPSVDLHALLQLVDRGCPPGLAARILAPLNPEEPG